MKYLEVDYKHECGCVTYNEGALVGFKVVCPRHLPNGAVGIALTHPLIRPNRKKKKELLIKKVSKKIVKKKVVKKKVRNKKSK